MDWGVPDWREKRAYPKSGDVLSLRQWWWEFTRRRPDYRQFWQDRWSPLQEFAAANAEWCGQIAERDGRSLQYEIEGRWSRHLFGAEDMRRLFRLNGLPDPRIPRDDDYLRHFHYADDAASAVWYGSLRALERDQQEGFVLYRFNLNRPIREQIMGAKHYLTDLQTEANGGDLRWRIDRRGWPLYLRALDAKDAGATEKDMMDVFWPGHKKPSASGTASKRRQSAGATYSQAVDVRDNFKI